MEILFVTDFVCPFCMAGSEALKQALREAGLTAEIKIQPFELTQEPKEQVDTFHDAKRRAGYQVLKETLEELGIEMKLPPEVIPRPYTRLAFEGWHYAESKGVGEAYADQVYRAYFTEEKDIGQMDVLTEVAVHTGLNSEEFRQVLEDGIYSQKQKEAVAYAREVLGVSHVPAIYVDGAKVEFPAYYKGRWLRFFQEQNMGEAAGDGGTEAEESGCGEDGCRLGGN